MHAIPHRSFPLCACLLCLVLGACGGDKDPTAPAPTAQATLPALDRSGDLAGPDKNANGIRDDIDAWIAGQPLAPAQLQALGQLARAFQAAVTADARDTDAARAAAWLGANAVACVMERLQPATRGNDTLHMLRKLTANTRARTQAYLAYAAALDGEALGMPRGDGCEE